MIRKQTEKTSNDDGEHREAERPALEDNVARLLRGTSPAPRMDAASRDRVLSALLVAQADRASEARALAKEGGAAAPTLASRKLRRAGIVGLGALALAAGITLYVARGRGPEGAVITPVTFENQGPGPRDVVLRDGTKATLDVGASLVERAPSDVELVSGQAVFDASRSGDARFRVKTATGDVEARATRFWVRASKDSAEVAVARGRASVTNRAGAQRDVAAGQEAVVKASGVAGVPAPRLSHLFGFARRTNADARATTTTAPARKGTLTGRDPTWQRESALDLRRFAVDVVVEDGFARTTIDQTYFNPALRQVEGLYAFPLPHGGALSRLAMYVDGKKMEAAVVERSRGRDVYEGIVNQRRDPALLEWMGADTFQMRIFPLPARTEKRVFLSYTAPLEQLYDTTRLVVPIPEVDQSAGAAAFRVRVVGGADAEISSGSHVVTQVDEGRDRIVTFDASAYALGQDLVLTIRGGSAAKGDARSFDQGADRFVRVVVDPELAAESTVEERHEKRSVAILFDVSASRSEADLAAEARLVDGLLDAIDSDDDVSIISVGHEAHRMPGGPVTGAALDRAAVAEFLRREARGVGDTRLDLGIAEANAALAAETGLREMIYVGDGAVVSMGAPVRAADLGGAVAKGTRFIGIGVGEGVDRAALERVASATGGFAITVGETDDLEARAFDVVATTYTRCLTEVHADVVDGSGSAVPGAIAELASRSVCDGERADVVARLPVKDAKAAAIVVRGLAGGRPWEKRIDLASATGGAAYLPRTFAERHVRAMTGDLAALADTPIDELSDAEKQIVASVTELAKASFLVTPFTSLLVLENDEMYKQFSLEKKAPSGWAIYAAPETIPVVTESLGSSAILADDGFEILERSPTSLLHEPEPWRGESWGGPVRRATVRMGGSLETQRTGRGRLSGQHRVRGTDALKKTGRLSAAFRSSLEPRFALSRDVGLGALGTLGASPAALDEVSLHSSSFGALAPLADRGGWMAGAFAGASLDAFVWSGDPRVRDLTEHVPSMFADELDHLSDLLAGAGISSSGGSKQDPQARALLDRALAAAPTAAVRLDGGANGVIAARPLADGGGFQRTRTLDTGLEEIATFERTALRFEHPELGLATVRDAGIAGIFWALREAPMLLPPPEAFAGLDLELVDARTLRVRAPIPAGAKSSVAATVPSIEIGLGVDLQIESVSWVHGRARTTAKIERTADSVTVRRVDGASATYRAVPGAASFAPADPSLVEISLPLHNPATATASAKADVVRGERQQIAAWVALQDDAKVLEHLALLDAAAGALSRGDLALASRALGGGSDAAKKLLARGPKGDPVRAFIEADAKRSKASSGLLSFLTEYRALLEEIGRGVSPAFARSLSAFRARHPEARYFLYALARGSAESTGWSDPKTALAIWDAIASDPELAPLADHAAARLSQGDDPDGAYTRLVRAFDVALERGWSLRPDWRDANVLTQARGAVAARVQAVKWREAILRGGRAPQLEALVMLASDPYLGASFNLGVDVGAIVTRLDRAADVDDAARVRVTDALLGRGLRAEAQILLTSLLDRKEPLPAALELRATVALDAGDLTRAAADYDRLLVVTVGEDLELETVRSWYRTLVSIHTRRAALASGPEVDRALADAYAVADRWRHEDRGNPEIDELCATALYQLGRRSEADAFVASIVDRRPNDAAAWGRAGAILERHGDFDGALGVLARAAVVEPTNPTWLMDRAELLMARELPGDRDAALDLVKKVVGGTWQPRFSNALYRAETLTRHARVKKP